MYLLSSSSSSSSLPPPSSSSSPSSFFHTQSRVQLDAMMYSSRAKRRN